MASLKQIRLVNVQSHADTAIDLPEKGVVRFYGDNSNGKSVFVKALWDILSGSIAHKPNYRRDLIRRGCQFCELTLTLHGGTELFAHIHLEAAQTYAELRRPGQSAIRRFLSDRAIDELVREFGFHYNPDLKISANLHRDDDPLLFVSTPYRTNYALMDSAVSDEFAEKALAAMQELLPELKKSLKSAEQSREVAETGLSSLALYDIAEEQARKELLEFLAHNIEHASLPPPPAITPLPNIVCLPTLEECPKLRYPAVMTYFTVQLPNIKEIAREIESLKASVCPTCERNFL